MINHVFVSVSLNLVTNSAIFFFLFLKAKRLPHSCLIFIRSLPVHAVGCGGGWGGKLHHAVLCSNGRRGLPHPDGDAGHILPRGPVAERRHHQAPQTGHFRPGHLPRHGVPHQGVLPGRHAGCSQGKHTRLFTAAGDKSVLGIYVFFFFLDLILNVQALPADETWEVGMESLCAAVPQ